MMSSWIFIEYVCTAKLWTHFCLYDKGQRVRSREFISDSLYDDKGFILWHEPRVGSLLLGSWNFDSCFLRESCRPLTWLLIMLLLDTRSSNFIVNTQYSCFYKLNETVHVVRVESNRGYSRSNKAPRLSSCEI